ncbi:MAG: hypothetical protein MUF71_01610 [Candidatus Kapabacteria bacterium]|nr:hypothetical protein [Candidatus Kapabacteria bacterium]
MSSRTLLRPALFLLFLGAAMLIVVPAVYAVSHSQQADSLNSSRIHINKTAMFTLGAWAVSNMAVNGTLLALQGNTSPQDRSSAYYFQQMNVFWNVVNLGLAAGGLYGAYTETPHGISLFETIDKQASIERILLLNAGLDAAYIAAGAWMLERSKNSREQANLWQGYGESLILQGAFLLVFDVAVYFIHHNSAEPHLREILSGVRVGVLPQILSPVSALGVAFSWKL